MTASMGLDNLVRSRKQDIIFLLKRHAKGGEDIYGDGVPVLPDGLAGSLPVLTGPDDIYVSPSQIRRFTCATVTHLRKIVPKDGERYFAAVKVTLNFDAPEMHVTKSF